MNYRVYFILLICFFKSYVGKSQMLDGEWKGYLISDNVWPKHEELIKLHIRLVKDSTYQIFSYCKGVNRNWEDTVVIAKVIYNRPSSDSLNLEEIEVIKPKEALNNCLIKMKLKILRSDNEVSLSGKWNSDCSNFGSVTLKRKG